MKKILLIAIGLLLAAHTAHASRGFGSTYGTGSAADVVYTTNNFLLPTKFSLSLWAYVHGVGGGNAGYIVSDGNAGGCPQFSLFANGSATSLVIFRCFSSSSGQFAFSIPSANKWTHILITYDASSVSNVPTVYVNGASVSVTTANAPVGTATTANVKFSISGGNGSPSTNSADGKYAQVALWNSALLTANEAVGLSKGASPLTIRPGVLSLYIPILGIGTGEPDWGPSHLPLTVTATAFQADPPVQPYPMIKYGQ